MTNLNMLKGKLKEKNKTYNECAAELGISTTSFNEKMNGKSRFKVKRHKCYQISFHYQKMNE